MKASNSKSQTEYIELADVVGVYLDVRRSIHSAYSPLVPHGVIELRCVPWHLCCKLPISMLHVANCPFRRCMLPHGALRTAAGAVAVVSPRQQRSSSTTSCSTTRTLLSSARCSAARARATRSSAASSSAPLRTHVATAPMQHAALQRSHRRRSPATACSRRRAAALRLWMARAGWDLPCRVSYRVLQGLVPCHCGDLQAAGGGGAVAADVAVPPLCDARGRPELPRVVPAALDARATGVGGDAVIRTPSHICTGTGPTHATSAPGPGPPPDAHVRWTEPRSDWAGGCANTGGTTRAQQ